MRIVFITTHFPPAQGYGGVCEASYGLVRAISDLGINVEVITSDASKNDRIKLEQFKRLETETLKIIPFRYTFDERNCFSFNAVSTILELSKDADIIHVNGIFTFPVSIGAIIASYLNKPCLISLHGGLLPATFNKKKIKKKIGFQLFVKKNLLSADCIQVTSDTELSVCREVGIRSKIVLVPNGINLNDFRETKQIRDYEVSWKNRIQGRNFILYLGRISQEKGINLLIEAWHEVIARFPEVLLIVAGTVFDRVSERIVNNVQNSGLKKSIIFTGNIEKDLKTSLLHEAEMLVIPSYSESFGIVVLEAMACNTPIIATEGTPWESIERVGCGFYVPTRSGAIASGIVKMLSIAKQERVKMGEKGYQYAASCFQWKLIAQKYLRIYKSIINSTFKKA